MLKFFEENSLTSVCDTCDLKTEYGALVLKTGPNLICLLSDPASKGVTGSKTNCKTNFKSVMKGHCQQIEFFYRFSTSDVARLNG